MALSKIDVANMVTGATPVANGGTGQTTLAAAGLVKRPNATSLIINGDMAVAQRSTSATSITGNGVNSIDRMYWAINSIGTYTCAQESLTSGPAFEAGFANAMRIDTTSADASPASADYLYLQYNMEGQDLQLFKKGTSSAEKFTLAFWVKSNKTGQANVEFKDKDNSNRHAIGSYTISSADTWEHKIVVINADTTGAFGDDNGGLAAQVIGQETPTTTFDVYLLHDASTLALVASSGGKPTVSALPANFIWGVQEFKSPPKISPTTTKIELGFKLTEGMQIGFNAQNPGCFGSPCVEGVNLNAFAFSVNAE